MQLNSPRSYEYNTNMMGFSLEETRTVSRGKSVYFDYLLLTVLKDLPLAVKGENVIFYICIFLSKQGGDETTKMSICYVSVKRRNVLIIG